MVDAERRRIAEKRRRQVIRIPRRRIAFARPDSAPRRYVERGPGNAVCQAVRGLTHEERPLTGVWGQASRRMSAGELQLRATGAVEGPAAASAIRSPVRSDAMTSR